MTKKKQPISTHPHISPLLAFCISVVTIGLYSYIWTSRRYREVYPKAGWASHWLVPTTVSVLAVYVGFNLTTFLPFMFEPHDGAVITAYGYYALWGIAQVMTAWWLVTYLTRIRESQQKVPIIVMALFFSPLAIYYLQADINGQGGAEGTSVKWLAMAMAVVFGVGTVSVVYSQYPIPQMVWQLESDYQTVNEYIQCHEELGARYPNDEIGAYQYQNYLDAYDDCEAIVN